jgi:putative ATP-dependent endonuclease of OLD family
VNHSIEHYIADGDMPPSFLNDEQIGNLAGFINDHLGKIRSFRDYAIKATIAPNASDMLTSLFYLSDGDRRINTTGSGVQFMAMATINVLCQIMELYKSKSSPFEEHLYANDGKKLLPIVLSIDEPEVHLHPYLQRSLIGFYKRILHNEDAEFVELLKLCFGIDGISGQLIVVTHSTDALIGDYRNLIRFYKSENNISVISGADSSLKFTPANEKHLIMRFPEIKEAFYDHCVILIEGETEYGCIYDFARKANVSLDDNGICVINARGEGSIKPLRQLLSAFAIPSVAIYDGDVKDGKTPADDEFFTAELCFEIEIIKTLYAKGQSALVRQIAHKLDDKAESVEMDWDFVHNHAKKLGLDSSYVPMKLSDVADTDEDEFCQRYSAWYMTKKGVLLGRIIGDTLTADLIPDCYINAIKKAQEVTRNV